MRYEQEECSLLFAHSQMCTHPWPSSAGKSLRWEHCPPARPHLCLLHRVFSFQSTWNKTLQSLGRGSACSKLMNQEICEFHDISFIKFFIFHDGKRVTLFPDLEQKYLLKYQGIEYQFQSHSIIFSFKL